MINKYIEYKWKDCPLTCAHRYIVPHIIETISRLEMKLDSKILDAGCGGGALVNTVYNFGFTNVWGFDASDSGIHMAKANFPKIADRFFKHNGYELKLPDIFPQTYDLILSMEVIEHLYSPYDYLQNLYKWLNEKGYLIITTPYHGYLKNLMLAVTNKFDRHFNPLDEVGHIKFFSKRSLAHLLNNAGFNVIKFKGAGRSPYLWKSMILAAKKIK